MGLRGGRREHGGVWGRVWKPSPATFFLAHWALGSEHPSVTLEGRRCQPCGGVARTGGDTQERMKARPPVLQKHKICLQLLLPSPENTPASHSCERRWTDLDRHRRRLWSGL